MARRPSRGTLYDGRIPTNRLTTLEANENLRRRSQSRKPFIASVLVFDPKSETQLRARTSDLGLDGCFIDTLNPFAPGTMLKVRIDKGGTSFETWAKVVYSLSSMGMGMVFHFVAPEQLWVLQGWLGDETEHVLLPEISLPPAEEEIAAAAFLTAEKTKDVHCDALSQLIAELTSRGLISEEKGNAILQTLSRCSGNE
jgi:PilZ domain